VGAQWGVKRCAHLRSFPFVRDQLGRRQGADVDTGRLFDAREASACIGEFIGVSAVFKRQSAQMIHIRVSRIDLTELLPNRAGLLRTT
jgi:hypothetical protein